MPTKRELQREIARLRSELRRGERLMREVLRRFEEFKGAQMALVITQEKIANGRQRDKSKHGS